MEITEQENARALKYLFILNPVAGVGDRRDFIHMISGACLAMKVKHKILFTRSRGDARKIIRKYFEKYDVFVAVGGDGTMNEVASALAGTTGIMGLIPAGSGNALGRELGISMKPEIALSQLLLGKTIQVDTGLVNGHRFMNVCGLGFDQHIASRFAKSVSRGPVPYFIAVLKEFFGYRPEIYEVETEGVVTQYPAFVLTVANTSQYGNNAYIAPKASVTDGDLDFCSLRPFGFFGGLGLGIRLFSKTIDRSRFYTGFKIQKVVIKGKNLNYHVDGEPMLNADTIQISIDPHSLNMVVPRTLH